MADTLFFAVMSFYGWSVGRGLDRSGNVTMAANSPAGGVKNPPIHAGMGRQMGAPQPYGKSNFTGKPRARRARPLPIL